MIKAHKIRLHPMPEQEVYFVKAAGTARFCYNWARAEWEQQYEAGEKPSALKLRTQFHGLRREQFPWTYEVTKCVIEGAFMDVGAAFKNFFEGRKAGRILSARISKTASWWFVSITVEMPDETPVNTPLLAWMLV